MSSLDLGEALWCILFEGGLLRIVEDCWEGVPRRLIKGEDHGFISKQYISIGMRPFRKTKSTSKVMRAYKWTISYHCGESGS